MKKLPGVLLIVLASGGNALAQSHNPWEWQKDQGKYALYYLGEPQQPRTRIFVNPPANTQVIYKSDETGYDSYSWYIANTYQATYKVSPRRFRTLYRDLKRQYHFSGVTAAGVHSFLETWLKEILSAEQYSHWLQKKIYPEYDPYFLEKGRPIKTAWDY